ncbi:hypothetical protein DPEC_G00237510 [Dallia pectoralis]|uniref:Uncharacterized protein n=1 Tax=Dallia pectoralis TaxID=75939 RepID=A0ACC2FYU7_DALPE|nr:hypothetical protein DPEC_G00237510 [Dallia pectoralis]
MIFCRQSPKVLTLNLKTSMPGCQQGLVYPARHQERSSGGGFWQQRIPVLVEGSPSNELVGGGGKEGKGTTRPGTEDKEDKEQEEVAAKEEQDTPPGTRDTPLGTQGKEGT